MTAEVTIRTQGLGKVYPSPKGDIMAVQDLDLAIQAGRIFGLLGPNGAGKTTTIRMLCGLIRPSGGAAWIDGLAVSEHPNEIRRRIGLVPEDAGDHKNLTLLEELEYHGALYGLDKQTVHTRSAALIDRLGLGPRAGHVLKTFSRGMRRKFHLIRALLHRPRILLLDEPTAGLDPEAAWEIWELLKTLAREHAVTVMLCSHHLEEVERLCDQVAILRRRLLVQGPLAELRSRDACYRVRLAADATASRRAIETIPGITQVTAHDSTLHLSLSGQAQEIMPLVVRHLVESGAGVVEVAREDRDLRSLYRSVIAEAEEQQNGVSPQ